jgi:uncharacterized lipoprotein YmbA
MTAYWRLALLLPLAAWLAGCAGTPETRYFALGNAEVAAPARPSKLMLAVGPVDLPRYLDRPQIVSRQGDNRLAVDEFNRWGGSLEEEIVRVLGDHLGRRLGSQRVYSYPSRIAAETDYRLALDIRAFDGPIAGEVRLDVTWTLIADRSGEILMVRQGVYRASAAGPGYGPYVSAMSEALGGLGDEVAAVLGDLGPPSPRP